MKVNTNLEVELRKMWRKHISKKRLYRNGKYLRVFLFIVPSFWHSDWFCLYWLRITVIVVSRIWLPPTIFIFISKVGSIHALLQRILFLSMILTGFDILSPRAPHIQETFASVVARLFVADQMPWEVHHVMPIKRLSMHGIYNIVLSATTLLLLCDAKLQ